MSLLRRFAPPQIILAASIPFLGYALAFMYERGYTGRFGVPMWMTRVSLIQALVASVAAAALVALTPTIARTVSRVASQWTLRIVLAPLAAIAVALWVALRRVRFDAHSPLDHHAAARQGRRVVDAAAKGKRSPLGATSHPGACVDGASRPLDARRPRRRAVRRELVRQLCVA
jgi:hypothetical protein